MTREEAVEIATKWATEYPHWQATDQVAQAVRVALSKLHQDAGNGELVEKLAAHIWTNIAGHPGAPAFAHEYGWSEEWPSDGELVRDLVRTIAKSAISYRAADALERGSQVVDGWVLVPREPTEAMICAGDGKDPGFGSLSATIYRAMLAAAPAHGGGG